MPGLRVLVCGGRQFTDHELLNWHLDWLWNVSRGIDTIIQGGCGGADALARVYAKARSIRLETYYPDWDRFGKSAGPIRNQRMIDQGKPDIVVAMPGGRGTKDMVLRAKKAGIGVIEAE